MDHAGLTPVGTRRSVPLPHSGPRTFMRAPGLTLEDVRRGDVAVLGVPWDMTSWGRHGARYGPQAIRDATLMLHTVSVAYAGDLVDIDTGESVPALDYGRLVDVGDLPLYPTDVGLTRQSIQEAVTIIVQRGALPVILGGDHYVTFPAFAGYALARQALGKGQSGYLHIDAHFDLIADNPIFGSDFYGATVRLLVESGLVKPANCIWLGVQGPLRREQYDFLQACGAHFFSLQKARAMGFVRAAQAAVEQALAGCDALYVSIDIDVVTSTAAPGTGAIGFDGFTPGELLAVMKTLSPAPIGAVDLVEVCPPWDPAGITERLAATALLNLIGSRASGARS